MPWLEGYEMGTRPAAAGASVERMVFLERIR